jgi:hypothetical protein
MLTYQVASELIEPLARIGITDFDSFLAYADGDLIAPDPAKPDKRPVRRVTLKIKGRAKHYYLKQAPHVRISKCINHLLQGRWPHVSAYREFKMLRFCRQQDIPVMRMVAWGEKRRLGWPLCGFLLVEEVFGDELPKRYLHAGQGERRQLMHAYGALIGFMHQRGVKSKVRVRDIICVTHRIVDFRDGFILIDRESGCPYKVRLSLAKRARKIEHMMWENIQIMGQLESIELEAFFKGYAQEAHLQHTNLHQMVETTAARLRHRLLRKKRWDDITVLDRQMQRLRY